MTTHWGYLQVLYDNKRHEWQPDGDANLTIDSISTAIDMLDQVGAEGWELITITTVFTNDLYWFKRPKD